MAKNQKPFVYLTYITFIFYTLAMERYIYVSELQSRFSRPPPNIICAPEYRVQTKDEQHAIQATLGLMKTNS